MSDIRLTWGTFAADVTILANDLEQDGGLETAVLLSLFTNAPAQAGDVLPPGVTDRGGWWADAHPVVEGDKWGSRLWLLARSKETPEALAQARQYALEALEWMKTDLLTERIEVEASIPRVGWLGVNVSIYRPGADPVRFQFNRVWDEQAARWR